MDIAIKELTFDQVEALIDSGAKTGHYEPIGLFYYKESFGQFTGIDNSTGEAWCETFKALEECKTWLLRKESAEEEKPPFDADAAEEYITGLCIQAKNERNRVFSNDNAGRGTFNQIYSDLYMRLTGEEIAYRKVLEYFAQFEF